MAIIGISGKIGSGKDTIGKIIQGLMIGEDNFVGGVLGFLDTYDEYLDYEPKEWQIKKFAGKLKQIVSILTGIPVEDLEKQEVKDRLLSPEWQHIMTDNNTNEVSTTKRTVRYMLQQVGTNAMRYVIHPNIWVNALFADYNCSPNEQVGTTPENLKWIEGDYPNWIITDCRFPNELEAIKVRGGVSIRVNRPYEINVDRGHGNVTTVKYDETNPDHVALVKGHLANQHESETALDDAHFDYVIDNNGTIEELIEKVKQILIKEKII